MARKKHRLKTHETGVGAAVVRRPAGVKPPDRPRGPARSPTRIAPALRALLVSAVTLLSAVLLVVLFEESEAAVVARTSGASGEPSAVTVHRALRLDGRSALSDPGRDQYVNRSGAFTAECWVRGGRPTGEQTVLGNRHYGGFGLTWSIASKRLDRLTGWLNMSDVPGTGHAGYLLLRPPQSWKTTTWTHVALVHDKGVARLFLNGTLRAEGVSGGRIRLSGMPLLVGADSTGTGDPEQFFTGEIDDVRISSVARYREDFSPPVRHVSDEHTALLLDFESSDEPFRDLSPAGRKTTVIGTPRAVTTTR